MSRVRLAVGLGVGWLGGCLAGGGGDVGGLEQQDEQVGGAGQPAEGDRAEQVAGGAGVLGAGGEDLGDPGDHGVDPGGVAGADAGDDVAQPGLVGAGQRDVAAALLGAASGVVGGLVGLDDLGLGDRDDAPGCLAGDRGGDGVVDQVDHLGGEPAGQGGDLARHPRLGLQGQHQGPGAGQAVAQVEDVGHDGARREGVHAAGDAELAQGQLADLRRALAADPVEPVTAGGSRETGRRARVQPRVAGVQVGPVRHQQQVLDLGGPAVPYARPRAPPAWRRRRARRSGGGPCSMIFDHTFEHKGSAAFVPPGRGPDRGPMAWIGARRPYRSGVGRAAGWQ